MTIAELVLEATVTEVEQNAPFDYTVSDVAFTWDEAQEAFNNLSEEDTDKFFEAMSENYSENSKVDPRW